jgi:hypothetical protein
VSLFFGEIWTENLYHARIDGHIPIVGVPRA